MELNATFREFNVLRGWVNRAGLEFPCLAQQFDPSAGDPVRFMSAEDAAVLAFVYKRLSVYKPRQSRV